MAFLRLGAQWAPNARAVSLVGEFCGWDREAYPMEKQYDGIWELRLPDALFRPERDPERYNYPEAADRLRTYKYAVLCADGEWHMRADPYGFEMEMRPSNGSRLRNLSGYEWHDSEWMEARKEGEPIRKPMNIYEMHLGTWRRGEGGRILNYAERRMQDRYETLRRELPEAESEQQETAILQEMVKIQAAQRRIKQKMGREKNAK